MAPCVRAWATSVGKRSSFGTPWRLRRTPVEASEAPPSPQKAWRGEAKVGGRRTQHSRLQSAGQGDTGRGRGRGR